MIGPSGDGLLIRQTENKSWLSLFYALPEEILDKRKEYYEIPRCPYEVLRTDRYDDLVNQDNFLELVWDSYAWAIWNNMKVPKEDGSYRSIPGIDRFYSGDFPLWRLSYHCVALMREKFQYTGLGFQELFNIPSGVEVPVIPYHLWWNLVGNTLDLIIKEQNLQPVIDEVWRNRTLEDYSEYYSRVKAAFEAQWYHRRTKVGKNTVSLEKIMEENGNGAHIFEIPDKTNYAANAVNRLFLKQFVSSLSEKDQRILDLKEKGYTDGEIAAQVEYQTHSAVVKRLQKISVLFDQYVKEAYTEYQETLSAG